MERNRLGANTRVIIPVILSVGRRSAGPSQLLIVLCGSPTDVGPTDIYRGPPDGDKTQSV